MPGLLRVGIGRRSVGGRTFDGWTVLLNTALAVGSDVVCLLTKIHAQCEIHGWVAGEDRGWLAGLVEQALSEGLLREAVRGHATGWCELVTALRRTSECAVVMSYSVTEHARLRAS